MAVIGIDLGGTKLATALLDDEGTLYGRTAAALDRREGAAVGLLIREQLHAALDHARSLGIHVDGIGMSVPGIFYARTGHVWVPNIPGWVDYPLLQELQESAGPKIRIRVDSDRACHLLGECWKGAARGCRDVILLAVGTGIGAGVLVDGNVLRGAGDAAGAIGWMALDRPYRPEYVQCGCFEFHASGPGMVKVAMSLLVQDETYTGVLRQKSAGQMTAEDLFAAWERDRDPLAGKVIDNAVECWGMAVANLVSLFNPEAIIFGGGLFGPAVRLIDSIAAEARRWSQPVSSRHVRFLASRLAGDAALYGAAYLALQRTDTYGTLR